MKADNRRKLENQLMVMGLRRLSDPMLVPMMAELIKDHDFFRGLLAECDQEKRQQMYDALRPHLKFAAWPLDRYIAQVKERASAMASKAKPITVGQDQFIEVSLPRATGAIVDLTCHKCTRSGRFYGPTPVQAVIEARAKGWVHDTALNKEICPKCPAIRVKHGNA